MFKQEPIDVVNVYTLKTPRKIISKYRMFRSFYLREPCLRGEVINLIF